ncbi:hypothetical protein EWH70_08020 [Amycolatopsis suaedae]|uniref:Uncharacterized protein n=1 Tax=Amycolatopsis suaedae TaxID=2510978 RepID=A0A4Q7JAW5_9PSEU|nr:hypothetical protein EWH70_08020 [Amycolatopsis suaedae]
MAEIRSKVSTHLRSFSAPLPDDLRTAVLVAFDLHEQARDRFYQDRVRWAAEELNRDARTVRRRIDDGILQLAQFAVAAITPAGPVGATDGWHTEELRVSLALDQPVAEAFEFRRIVADSQEISELDLALTLTPPDDRDGAGEISGLEVDVFHGGTLIDQVPESSDRAGLVLRLPSVLGRGEQHDVALRYRAALRYPHYVCVPRRPVGQFDLHVRFARPVPDQVVRLDKVFQEDARNRSVHGTMLTPDESGEVHVRFRGLVPGFAYGVRWQ